MTEPDKDPSDIVNDEIQNPSKKSRKERPFLVFQINDTPFVLERKYIPESGILRDWIDGDSDNISIKDPRIDAHLLGIVIQDIRLKNNLVQNVKIELSRSQYNVLLYIIYHFNLTYDHSLKFQLHRFHKYTFMHSTIHRFIENCCYLKQVCIFDMGADVASVHFSIILKTEPVSGTRICKYKFDDDNNVFIYLQDTNPSSEWIRISIDENTAVIRYTNKITNCEKCTKEPGIVLLSRINIQDLVPRNIDFDNEKHIIKIR